MANANGAVIKGAYWPTWSADAFPSSAIDTTLFTHIYYAFLIPNSATYTFQLSNSQKALLQKFIAGLQGKSPRVKTLISIGGASDEASTIFTNMASDGNNRKAFIESSIQVAREFGFDGLDLDWEFPGTQDQMKNLGDLLREWRAAVTTEAQASGRAPLLLAAAVNFSSKMLYGDPRSFPTQSMAENLDWINVMCYDYHGKWDLSATGSHAAFYDPNSKKNSDFGLRSWINAGMPKNKIIMGLPLYGRSWNLTNPGVNGIGAHANGIGPGDQEGIIEYSQVKEFNQRKQAKTVYDPTTISTYSYSGTSWVSYDDVTSTTEKIKLAKGLGLRGYFFWALGQDNNWELSTTASRSWI